MRRAAIVVPLVVVAAVIGGGVAVTGLAQPQKDESGPRRSQLPAATERVVRGDLTSSTSVDGTLGYSRERKLNAGASGTLTWVTRSGSTVKRDGRLYALGGKDVRLMYGSEPMYRTLQKGDTGTDVKQLKENLVELGYGGALVADDKFTAGTAAAVERWQEHHGLAETGRIGADQIAFASGPLRVQSVNASAGDVAAPGQKIMTTTGSDRVVRLEVKVSEAALAKPDHKVRVELPDGTVADGTVSSVGEVATTGDDPDDKAPKVDVTVTFDDPGAVEGVDKSPATVVFTGRIRKDVLSVPVSALLALEDGSFGVQVVAGGKAREVKVRLGMFAQGRVEVSGAGVRDGMRVGVPTT
ncbi:peptidoglycan-binding protein [Streptomyces sp. NPDC059455]|uniref:peptidoglycan-binding protein n=1 Tax=Streptomyces sp. NPDC059455 TaxID=3346837 RepID=UPI0036C0CB80